MLTFKEKKIIQIMDVHVGYQLAHFVYETPISAPIRTINSKTMKAKEKAKAKLALTGGVESVESTE